MVYRVNGRQQECGRRSLRHALRIVFVALLMLMVAAACAPDEEPPDNGTDPVVTDPEDDPPAAFHPFTGEPSDDPDAFVGRPLMVMFDNNSSAHPHTRLQDADVIYEGFVEAGHTRLAGIFLGMPEGTVGPVRSIRPNFVHVSREWDAVPIHAGGSNEALLTLSQEGDDRIDARFAGGVFFRDNSRRAPHNLYLTGGNAETFAQQRGFGRDDAPAPKLSFIGRDMDRRDAPRATGLAYQVNIPLRVDRSGWELDPDEMVYRRNMRGSAHMDTVHGQITRRNVVILQTSVTPLRAALVTVDMTSGGNAWVIRDGAYWEARWSYGDNGLELHTPGGREIPLSPGTTWIHVISNQNTVQISAEPQAGGS